MASLADDSGPIDAPNAHALAAARAAFRQGDFAEAAELYGRELAARRERLGAGHLTPSRFLCQCS